MLEGKTPSELIDLVRQLVGEVTRLRGENEKLSHAVARLRLDNQALKDELGRLKHLPPRPPQKPSGMEKATDQSERGAQGEEGEEGEAAKRRRGPGVSKLSIDRTETLSVAAPAGSRHKGFEDIIVQDLMAEGRNDTISTRALGDTGRQGADCAAACKDCGRLRARILFVWC